MAVNVCYCVKLSPNKKSIFGLNMSQILYFVLFVGFLAVTSAADAEVSCVNVRSIFEKKGMLSSIDIQAQPNSDAGEICASKGCCGAGARTRFTQDARSQLEGALRSELSKLAEALSSKAKRFDEFFRRLLQLSRQEFHAMFKRTYGMIYEQHSYVFEKLFEELDRYYTRGDRDFDEMMDGFFSILYEKMFTVLNSQYSFDEKYLKCVSENMKDIKPFDDVPSKLSVQLRRAFVATRTFHKALRAGADVVKSMMQIGVTPECVAAWARLRYCGSCSGQQVPACARYCHNVIKGCLPAHSDLGEQWDAYVDAVEKVADRLLGPFNIAMVVEPIDIKISEAIMSFQERNQEISQKIFSGCGKPVLGGGGSTGPFFAPDRSRRFARSIPDVNWYPKASDVDDFEIEASFESLVDDPIRIAFGTPQSARKLINKMREEGRLRERLLDNIKKEIALSEYEEHARVKRDAAPEAGGAEIDFKSYEFDGKRGSKKKKPKSDDVYVGESGPALEKLVRETRVRIRASRRYWLHLPAVLCASTSVTSAPCFNGSHVASYTAAAAGDGGAALASNPEVRSLTAAPPAPPALDALRSYTARLKDAYNGVEVQWKDTAEDLQAAAAAPTDFVENGSGSGSGDDEYDDNLPPDDEDKITDDYAEGSGDARLYPSTTAAPHRPASEVPVQTTFDITPRIIEPDTSVPIQPELPVVPDQPIQTDLPDQRNVPEPPRPTEQPVAASADRPSLQNALFSYALPVVCAWFGTIVTDLF